MKKISILLITISIVFLFSCNVSESTKFVKNPTDSLITAMQTEKNFTIILNDMDYRESDKNFVHKYQIIKPTEKQEVVMTDSLPDDSIASEITGWIPVSESFFNTHEQDLGMEIVSKTDGKISKTVSPPGYSQYVGNSRYGEWRESNGHSTWHFFGQYLFMSTMFHMAMFPVRRSYYNGYRTNRIAGRNYYGSSAGGGRMYGSNSSYSKSTNTHSSWGKRPSTYKQSSRRNSKIQRNSSRYKNKSTRSRSGGYGK